MDPALFVTITIHGPSYDKNPGNSDPELPMAVRKSSSRNIGMP